MLRAILEATLILSRTGDPLRGCRATGRSPGVPLLVIAAMIAVSGLPDAASAAAGEPIPGAAGLWRDFRGANNVGIVAGDRLEYRVNIEGGALGGTIRAQYTNTAGNLVFTSATGPCGPTTANPDQCGRSVAFNPSRVAGSWAATIVNPTGTYQVGLPSIASVPATPMPLVTDVRISGTGTTPTFSWSLPATAPIDRVTVTIYDNAVRRSDFMSQSDAIFVRGLGSGATSFTVPSQFGQGLSLAMGGDYTISVNIRDTRDNQAGGGLPNILNQSRSFVAFTPLTSQPGGPVYLPQVIETPGAAVPLYQFGFQVTDPLQTYYIDPASAIGYRYRTGAGDPNFASVVLPAAGDDDFLLSYLFGGQWLSTRLLAGDRFLFPQGGVSAFDVGGIEESAGLDPFDATAFITGLTFIGAGSFTGTMEPVVAAIPVPAGALLFASGLIAFGWTVRRWRHASLVQHPAS